MNQDVNQNNLIPNDDDNQQNSQTQGKNVRVGGGPEGQAISMESAGSRKNEATGEVLKQIEANAEKEAKEMVRKETIRKKKEYKKKKKIKKKKRKKIEGPKVYGYKIPSKISHNLDKVSKFKGKGDPKKGLSCLYVLLDRLLRMTSK